ncbi:MAG: GlmU family protein [Bacteroidales bacterium]|nr:GlmU family protein [Bacteroidales bacterium]
MKPTANMILFDDIGHESLLPLTFTRPVAEIRIGITTIKEKWESLAHLECSYFTKEYLSKKFPAKFEDDNLFINASVIPNENLVDAVSKLKKGELLVGDETVIAYRSSEHVDTEEKDGLKAFKAWQYSPNFICIKNIWDIFEFNEILIIEDFKRLTKGRKTQKLSETNKLFNKNNIFVEEGAKVECSILNADTGPIYIGRDTEIMEGAVVRGPHALCEHSTIKIGAKIYTGTTIGPHSKVGGEVHSSVFTGYSNKAHDGFLGNAVLGEWCNLGADSNNSNLKNNYAKVKMWSYIKERFIDTGLQFCGLVMGDHSKCGINTMFNTGTVIGVSANIYGSGFPRNFIPSFSWGGAGGFILYKPEKAFETAEIAMARRGHSLSNDDMAILQHIFNITEKYRKF